MPHADKTERSPGGLVYRLGQLARTGLPVLKLGTRRLLGGKSPFQITFSLTNRCNFRCEYCDIPLQTRDELTTAQWCAAIDDLREGGMGRASLIGGEPLLHDDLGIIIRHLKRRGVHTALNTNGWFVPERLADLRLLDLVCVTLDGPPEVHDGQRRAGSYAKVLQAIEALRGAAVPVVTMTVLTPSGAAHADHVLELARTYGFKAFFQLEHDKGCDVMAPIAPRLSGARISELATHLLEQKAKGWPVGNSQMLLENQRDRGRYLGTCAGCYAGAYYAYVLSDGTVAPCLLTQWQAKKGNGRERGFLRAFHEMSAPDGPGCSCVPIHEVNRVLAFDPRALWHAMEMTLDAPSRG